MLVVVKTNALAIGGSEEESLTEISCIDASIDICAAGVMGQNHRLASSNGTNSRIMTFEIAFASPITPLSVRVVTTPN